MVDVIENLLNMRWVSAGKNSFQLKIVYWDGNQKRVTTIPPPFRPYFFIKERDLSDEVKSLIRSADPEAAIEKVDAVTREGERVVKISASKPSKVREIRDLLEVRGVKTYEADIPYVRRVMIDRRWRVRMPSKIAAFDVEVDASKGFPDVNDPTSRCLSISIYDGEEEIFICEDDEVAMFREFFKVASRYEVLFGWNSAVFDYPYIINRARKLGVEFDRDMFTHLDLYGLYLRVFSKEEKSFKLKDVALRILGDKTPLGAVVDFEAPGQIEKLTEFFKTRRDLLRFYNMDQTKATFMIAQATGLIPMYIFIAQYAHIIPWHGIIDRHDKFRERKYISYNVIVDSLVLVRAQERSPRIVFPTKEGVEKEEKYTGALVLDPTPGYHEAVSVLDFAAIYPRIIQTFNVSYETWVPEPGEKDILALHGGFRTDREGVLPQIVDQLTDIREESKKMRDLYPPTSPRYMIWNARQFGIKLVLVSLYGTLGFPGARFYQKEIAENITHYCRDALRESIEFLRRRGIAVLYSDTDSVFVKIPGVSDPKIALQKIVEEILPELNEHIRNYVVQKYRVPPSRVRIEFKVDRVFERLKLLTVKKRYYGKVVWEDRWLDQPYLYVKGFEVRRGDWPDLVKEIQQRVMELDIDLRWSEIRSYLEEVKRQLLAGRVPVEKLVLRKGISRPLGEYKNTAPHVVAARVLEARGIPVRVGDKIEYIFLDGKVIPYEPGLKLSRSDLLKWWEKYVIPVVERLEIPDLRQARLEVGEWLMSS